MAHIRQIGAENKLVLCEATAVVHDFHGRMPAVKICKRCMNKMAQLTATHWHFGEVEALKSKEGFARAIGVREITE